MNKIEYISSISNEKIKRIKGLHKKKNRTIEGLFIIEGIKMVEECLLKKYNLDLLVISKSFLEGNKDKTLLLEKELDNIIYVEDKVYREITDTENPQGILALSKLVDRNIDNYNREDKGLYLILDEVQDPGNMGTIIRTADAFGIRGIFLGKGCVDPHNPKVVRATMGSIFRVPIYNINNLDRFRDLTKGIDIYAGSLDGSREIYNVDYENAMLIIGNESKGVSEEYSEMATGLVKIPMVGETESLNAAVASSIIMYEAMRQKMV